MKKRVHCFICKAITRLLGCPAEVSPTSEPSRSELIRQRAAYRRAVQRQAALDRSLSAQELAEILEAQARRKSTEAGDLS